jgi:hypothetical protein
LRRQERRRCLIWRARCSLKDIWPSQSAELLGSELGFDGDGVVVHLRYQSPRPLDATAGELLANALKSRFAVPQLRVSLDYEKPPRTRKAAPSR